MEKQPDYIKMDKHKITLYSWLELYINLGLGKNFTSAWLLSVNTKETDRAGLHLLLFCFVTFALVYGSDEYITFSGFVLFKRNGLGRAALIFVWLYPKKEIGQGLTFVWFWSILFVLFRIYSSFFQDFQQHISPGQVEFREACQGLLVCHLLWKSLKKEKNNININAGSKVKCK